MLQIELVNVKLFLVFKKNKHLF